MKKALCIGINDYPYVGSDLNGCINDAKNWSQVLKDLFGFTDFEMLLDSNATKKHIMGSIKEFLLAESKSGDVLALTWSSHGTYVADTTGDEKNYDEAMCPYDMDDNLIVDDELRELFEDIPSGVRMTVIADSCFSGTVTRVGLADNYPGIMAAAFTSSQQQVWSSRRVRFLSPALRGDPVIESPWAATPRRILYPQSKMVEVLFSGCKDTEYSYDAKIGGAYNGAMSYYACQVIRQTNGKVTWSQLRQRVQAELDKARFPQHPQAEGNSAAKRRRIFS